MSRNNKVRWILVAVFIILAGYFIYPTVKYFTLNEAQTDSLTVTGQLPELKAKALKLGLDLQGGMYLQLEVDLIRLMENLAHHKDAKFEEIRASISEEMYVSEDFYSLIVAKFTEAGVPLNRYFGEPRQSDSEIMDYIREQATDAINRSLEILRNRIDEFGLTEPSIMKRGQRRIIIELPGVDDPQRARALIGKTAQLEFTLVAEMDITNNTFTAINDFMKGVDPDSLLAEVAAATDEETAAVEEAAAETEAVEEEDAGESPLTQLQQEELVPEADLSRATEEEPFLSYFVNFQGSYAVSEDDLVAVKRILEDPEVQRLIPPDLRFIWGRKTDPGPEGLHYYPFYLIKKEAALTGQYLKNAYADVDQGYSSGRAGQAVVTFELDRQGARTFGRVTGDNIDRRLAIVLDNRVFMAPNIRSKIPHGRGIIEGMESMEAAKDLAIVLRAGALPAPVDIIEERTVGPSLGRDSIRSGSYAVLLGLSVVMLFMVVYYRVAGLISVVALVLNMFFMAAVLAGFHATLTLPGIAGIILTIGMAVDANVLIFERIREERRSGKTIKAAIESGFDRAFTTILDANVTTLIATLVLYQFGTGPLKGFAITLMIGIVASMYTAIVVSHLIFDFFYGNRDNVEKISI